MLLRASMQQPFQCIATVQRQNGTAPDSGFLLAACGATLLSVDLSSGDIVSRLSPKYTEEHHNEPPAKKQKTEADTIDAVVSGNIIKLTVSLDHRHAVVVTDDKYVRVISIGENGDLDELSTRCMPKRPCAVQVLPDNTTILCGDKFGDVYSLPLHPKDTLNQEVSNASGDVATSASPIQNNAKPFKPSATDKTVHTQRNLKSLAAQQNQKNLTPKTKEPLKFEHKLLLGHVSMLTDLTYATREIDGKQRGYIITADRDEHIRISRAPPQSHVIEGYCLGHKQFVSKVCIVPGTDLLVSGGGDDWIGVWDWPSFRLLRKIPLPKGTHKGPVTGIWVVPTTNGDVLFVIQERVPALYFLLVQDIMLSDLLKADLREIPGVLRNSGSPILDLAYVEPTIVLSMDARMEGQQRLLTSKIDESRMDEVLEAQLMRINAFVGNEFDEAKLDDLLYGIVNLRKRAHNDDDNENG